MDVYREVSEFLQRCRAEREEGREKQDEPEQPPDLCPCMSALPSDDDDSADELLMYSVITGKFPP